MKYCDLRPALKAYSRGDNVIATLRTVLSESENTAEIIEIAYDLQAGSYVKLIESDPLRWKAYCDELVEIIRPIATCLGGRVLDVGTGEMTTLAGVANGAFPDSNEIFACDISLSRIKVGEEFIRRFLEKDRLAVLIPFVGNLFNLPFLDSSIDLIWTSHSLEPNGGKEFKALKELFRISSDYVLLFEPSYENNSAEGKERMEGLGYVKNLPQAIKAAGGELIDNIQIKNVENVLNPTYAYVCRKINREKSEVAQDSPWACPATRLKMVQMADYFFSPASLLAYPVIQGIPILRKEQAILASALRE